MDKLEVAVELIRRAQQERKRPDAYTKEIERLRSNPPGGRAYWDERSKIELKYSPTPRKSVINDSLRMARRLLIEEYV